MNRAEQLKDAASKHAYLEYPYNEQEIKDNGVYNDYDLHEAAVDFFIMGAGWADANRWVKVEDGLPTVGDSVLILESGKVKVARYETYHPESPGGREFGTSHKWFAVIDGNKHFRLPHHNITHWMPLPEPPKVEQ